jgi:hypothetical protein
LPVRVHVRSMIRRASRADCQHFRSCAPSNGDDSALSLLRMCHID